jgi:hypothetical protein
MDQEKGIWDIVESGNLAEVIGFVKSNVALIDQHLEFIQANLGKAERNFVLYNLLAKVNLYLYCLVSSLSGPIEVIGFISRSLFELSLITRYVLMSEENLIQFVAESAVDKVQLLEGLLETGDIAYKEDVELIKEEVAKLKTTPEKFNFPSQKPNSIKTIARIVDSELEYKALYKLFSKYVHPSSFSINLGSEALMSEDRLRHTFLAFALTHAVVTFQQIREATVGRVE